MKKIILIAVLFFILTADILLAADLQYTWKTYTNADRLGSNFCRAVYASGSNIYVAANGGLGISTDNGAHWMNLTTANGLADDYCLGVYASGSNIYVATISGLSISTDNGVHWNNYTTADGLGDNFCRGVYASGSNIYVARQGGLSISTDGGTHWRNYTTADGLGSNICLGLCVSDGNIYVATIGGLSISKDNGAHWTNLTTANGLVNNNCNCVSVSGGNIYVVTPGGLSISADGGAHWMNLTTANGLVSNSCVSVYGYGSNIYVGTISGLSISTDGGTNWLNVTANAQGLANDVCYGVYASESNVYVATWGGGLSVATLSDGSSGGSGINLYRFARVGSIITYTRQDLSAQTIANIQFDESLLGLSGLTTDNMQPMVTMTKAASGKLYLNVTGNLATSLNAMNGAAWVTANFVTNRLRPIIMNGLQISDSKGHIFPAYTNYVDNISFSGGILTFRIKHFTEYGVPALESKTFAGSGAGLNIVAQGSNIIAEVTGNSFVGTSLQNTTTTVAKISGLAYETVLSDIPSTMNNLYKPLTPGSEYGISFEYINRGNATDTANINLVLTTANVGHYGYSITTDTQVVAPWQVLLFDVKVNANNANAFERATLDATVALPEVSVVSYNAFANAYLGGTFEGVSGNGTYGGVKNLNHMFILEAEGYNVAVLSRTATINVPAGYTGSSEDMVPGSKVIYSIAIKNNSTAAATSVNVADQIANNCHLYYTDTPAVEGAMAWEWKGVTNNNATSADTNAVKFEITIPASGVVTVSYTVTLD